MCVCMFELPQHFVVVYGGEKCEGGMGSLNTSQNVCGLQALLQHFYLTNHIYMYIYLELNKAITFSKCLMCGRGVLPEHFYDNSGDRKHISHICCHTECQVSSFADAFFNCEQQND